MLALIAVMLITLRLVIAWFLMAWTALELALLAHLLLALVGTLMAVLAHLILALGGMNRFRHIRILFLAWLEESLDLICHLLPLLFTSSESARTP